MTVARTRSVLYSSRLELDLRRIVRKGRSDALRGPTQRLCPICPGPPRIMCRTVPLGRCRGSHTVSWSEPATGRSIFLRTRGSERLYLTFSGVCERVCPP